MSVDRGVVGRRHEGRRALVTGAGSGIGRACAESLGAEGSLVSVADVNADAAALVAERIKRAGGSAVAVGVDVSQADSVFRGVESAVGHFGGLDYLVTCAGIQRYGDAVATTEELWDEVFAVNVKGAFLSVKAALPHLRQSEHASIVMVSSVQAYVAQTGAEAYVASKGAVNALMRAIAVDEAPRGVRVNAICPGSIDTPMLRWSAELFAGGSEQAIEATLQRWGRSHPLGRVGAPDEVARVISFLLSDEASFVTGEDVRVDGGLLASVAVELPASPMPGRVGSQNAGGQRP